jgi:RNA recognition motif-containing protein
MLMESGNGHNGNVNDSQEGSLDDCNVFVKYLPPELTDVEFHKLFKDFGNIISSKIMIDQGTGKSLGYGFVRFNNSASSRKAIRSMNGFRLSNKRLLCKLANTSPSSFSTEYNKHPLLNNQTPSDNLYIKPLLKDTTEDDLRKLFSKYGNIMECKVMIDRNTGLSRQIGFVRYENAEHAKYAIEEMNNYKLYPSAPPLTVKYADTKEQKQARKALRQQQPTTTSAHNTPKTDQLTPPLQTTYYYYHHHQPPYPAYNYPYPFPYPDLYPPQPTSPYPPHTSPQYSYDYPPPPLPSWVNYGENGYYEPNEVFPSPESISSPPIGFYNDMFPPGGSPIYPFDNYGILPDYPEEGSTVIMTNSGIVGQGEEGNDIEDVRREKEEESDEE